jgi:hypothetical protein
MILFLFSFKFSKPIIVAQAQEKDQKYRGECTYEGVTIYVLFMLIF